MTRMRQEIVLRQITRDEPCIAMLIGVVAYKYSQKSIVTPNYEMDLRQNNGVQYNNHIYIMDLRLILEKWLLADTAITRRSSTSKHRVSSYRFLQ